MTKRMRKDLEELAVKFEKRSWHPREEPIIGSQDCPALAEQYGVRGQSCYVVFVYKQINGRYGCRHERCFRDGGGHTCSSIQEAIHHQYGNHF